MLKNMLHIEKVSTYLSILTYGAFSIFIIAALYFSLPFYNGDAALSLSRSYYLAVSSFFGLFSEVLFIYRYLSGEKNIIVDLRMVLVLEFYLFFILFFIFIPLRCFGNPVCSFVSMQPFFIVFFVSGLVLSACLIYMRRSPR